MSSAKNPSEPLCFDIRRRSNPRAVFLLSIDDELKERQQQQQAFGEYFLSAQPTGDFLQMLQMYQNIPFP